MPKQRALIVDDSTTAQYRLKKMLRPYDLDIDTADSGEAALRYLAHHSPNVIFMDHLMPGMDGFRALQIIKSHPETATIPVIMYTSKSGDLYTGQARALGALDVVSKDTINAADLSKVMEAIHIYRSKPLTAGAEDQETKLPANQTARAVEMQEANIQNAKEQRDDEPKILIDRRAPNPAALEQARNLELRLSHMEHTLEDNRRFITARVARELNGLRHNLKKELTELFKTNHVEHHSEVVETEPPAQPPKTGYLLIGVSIAAFFILLIGLTLIYSQLSETRKQQQLLSEQIKTLNDAEKQLIAKPTDAVLASKPESTPAEVPPEKVDTDDVYLSTLAWTFNQNGFLPFNQNSIEPKKLMQLFELLNRIRDKGFKGSAWINIYVGNFCVTPDSYGIAQLPKEGATISDCVLSSEIYGLDRVTEEYTRNAESALSALEQDPQKRLRIIVNSLSEPDNYPDHKPTVTAKSWNLIAQNHNRIELKLEAASAP